MALRRATLIVEGMSCAACVSSVERSLIEVEGVVEARVNYVSGRALVTCNEAVTNSQLRAAVAAAGYLARLPDVLSSDGLGPDGLSPDGLSGGHGIGSVEPRRLILPAGLTVVVALVTMVDRLAFDLGFRASDWLAAILAAGVVFGSGRGFFRRALKQLHHRTATMDTLVAVGTGSSWVWSTVVLAARIGDGHLYFETGAVIVVLVLVGNHLELRARRRAGDALQALAGLAAPVARLEDGTDMAVEDLQVGTRFVVRPGERIATDGVIIAGVSAVDVSMITGEPVPIEVGPGNKVLGASVNANGSLVVEATAVGAGTTLARIMQLVDRALTNRSRVQRLADRISAVFVPAAMVIAVGALIGWLAAAQPASEAFTAAVAVLIVACPCALGLATPLAVMVGTGRGSQLGIIVKGGEMLEDTRRLDTVVLDKTGTVTEARMQVVGITAPAGDPEALLALAAAVEARSEHPIGRAIAREVGSVRGSAAREVGSVGGSAAREVGSVGGSAAREVGSVGGSAAREVGSVGGSAAREIESSREVTGFENFPGVGAVAVVGGIQVRVGKRALFERVPEPVAAEADKVEAGGRVAVLVGRGSNAEAVITVDDRLRDSAPAAVAALKALGLDTVLLTGDHPVRARLVADDLGIDRVVAGVGPGGKAAEIARLQNEGRRVAMVGDGINDAPALSQADIGIAIGSGTDVAAEASDITIMSPDLRSVADAIALSRRTMTTIRANLFWAFIYNTAAIPLAAAGVLEPMFAAAAMVASSLFVVTNSLRLRRFRRG